MAEYITKEAAIEAFENGEADVIEDYGDGADFGFGLNNIKSTINAIPAADVATVMHSYWESYDCHQCGGNQWLKSPGCSDTPNSTRRPKWKSPSC